MHFSPKFWRADFWAAIFWLEPLQARGARGGGGINLLLDILLRVNPRASRWAIRSSL